MKEYSKAQMDKLVREKLEGKSYSEIRKDLLAEGMDPEETSRLIRQVDERVLEAEVRGSTPDRARIWYYVGLIMAIAGLVLTISYNAGWILQGLPTLLVYAPFLLGILLMFYGKTLQRKRPRTEEKGPGAIRKRRPFK